MTFVSQKNNLGRIRKALLGPKGLALLRFMRSLGLNEYLVNDQGDITRSAIDLGWCYKHNNRLQLTNIGSAVSDSAREYINWIDDKRNLRLPVSADVGRKRVLDVGCGWGRYVLTLRASGAECIGIDPGMFYLELGKIFAEQEGEQYFPTVCGNAELLPFEDNFFDFILCIRSFAYLNQPKALREFQRVLRPEGRLIIATPTIEMWLSNFRRNWLTPKSLPSLFGGIRWLLNSYSVSWFGNRPFFLPAGLKNVAYPSISFMTSIEKQFGFRAIKPFPVYEGGTAWFVFERS